MCCRALWVQLTLSPPTAEASTSHYVPLCSSGGHFVLFTADIHAWTQCPPLLAAFVSQYCVQCQQKLELLPPTVWMTRMSQETGCFRFILDLFWSC